MDNKKNKKELTILRMEDREPARSGTNYLGFENNTSYTLKRHEYEKDTPFFLDEMYNKLIILHLHLCFRLLLSYGY